MMSIFSEWMVANGQLQAGQITIWETQSLIAQFRYMHADKLFCCVFDSYNCSNFSLIIFELVDYLQFVFCWWHALCQFPNSSFESHNFQLQEDFDFNITNLFVSFMYQLRSGYFFCMLFIVEYVLFNASTFEVNSSCYLLQCS